MVNEPGFQSCACTCRWRSSRDTAVDGQLLRELPFEPGGKSWQSLTFCATGVLEQMIRWVGCQMGVDLVANIAIKVVEQ